MAGTVQGEREAADGLRVADHDGVLVATLDRPPANALNGPLVLALTALFQGRGAHAPRPMVITGAGTRVFCAGGDIKEVDVGQAPGAAGAAERMRARMQAFHDLLAAMERYPAPVIAAVNGDCVGGGVELALFADAVLAAPHARFGFPEIRHGLLPADKGIQRVVRLIGMRAARDLLLGGELIEAEAAARLGVVDALVPPDQLLSLALGRAREAGRRAPVLYAALKHALNDDDDTRDQRQADTTLAKAAAWIDDPVARGLREGWRQERAAANTPPHAGRAGPTHPSER